MPAPSAADFEVHLAQQALRHGDRAGAERRLKAALKAAPRHPRVLAVLGAFLVAEKRYREAEPILRAATKTAAVSDATDFHYGLALQNLNRANEAFAAFGKALAKNPNSADAWFGRGSVLLEDGKPEKAIAQFDRVLALDPDYFRAHHNKGAALLELGRYAEAALHQDACLRINPSFAPAHFAKALALQNLRQFALALGSVETGLALTPDCAVSWRLRADICRELRRFDEAIANMGKALSLQPTDKGWRDGLIELKLMVCEWSSYRSDFEALREEIRSGAAVSPTLSVTLPFSAAEQFQAAAARVGVRRAPSGSAANRLADERRGRIRLAYFSGELRNHATAHLFAGALERHDKARFEVTVFNLELRDGSPLQQRIVDAVDDFIDVHGLGGERLVKLIRDKRIDILVNLDFSNDELPNSVFLQRPAPVQVNYLGHPGTAALGGCDYLVADSVVIPPEQKRHYLEKIVYLPDCYQANSSHEIAARPMRRAEWGLPEQGFVFCGFNRNLKLNPDTLDGWSRILLASPGSALWLLQDSFTAVANLRKEAAARGVDPARLVFAERVSSAEHLARHRLADLFLDTLPYNAHTTVSDALWAGVPALTRIGETFAGRVGASVLAAVGLPELVVDTQEAYEATAIDLAANPDRLSALREKLARNLPTAPLFDAKLFATRLQTAYEAMHARRLAGLPPDDIVVPA